MVMEGNSQWAIKPFENNIIDEVEDHVKKIFLNGRGQIK